MLALRYGEALRAWAREFVEFIFGAYDHGSATAGAAA